MSAIKATFSFVNGFGHERTKEVEVETKQWQRCLAEFKEKGFFMYKGTFVLGLASKAKLLKVESV